MANRSDERLRGHVVEQMNFMRASCEAFDRGNEIESKRLATSVRVLLHTTNRSRSLLAQLHMEMIPFYTTNPRWDPTNLAPHMYLMQRLTGGKGGDFYAPLDDRPPHLLRWIPFTNWWSEYLFDDRQARSLKRSELVLTLANKEGGAHVDPELNEQHESLKHHGGFGYVAIIAEQKLPFEGDLIAQAMRQVAHEVITTLMRAGFA